MPTYYYGPRCRVDVQPSLNNPNYFEFCHHHAIISPPVRVVEFLMALEELDRKLQRKGVTTMPELIDTVKDVRLESPVEGSRRAGINQSRLRQFRRVGNTFGPALLHAFWHELHLTGSKDCKKTVGKTGAHWQIITELPDWRVGLVIYGQPRSPVLGVEEKPPSVKIASDALPATLTELRADATIEALSTLLGDD